MLGGPFECDKRHLQSLTSSVGATLAGLVIFGDSEANENLGTRLVGVGGLLEMVGVCME